jgi:hypothetical protein
VTIKSGDAYSGVVLVSLDNVNTWLQLIGNLAGQKVNTEIIQSVSKIFLNEQELPVHSRIVKSSITDDDSIIAECVLKELGFFFF